MTLHTKATSITLSSLKHLLPRFKLHVNLRLCREVHVRKDFDYHVGRHSHDGHEQHKHPTHRPSGEDMVSSQCKIRELTRTLAADELVGRNRKQIQENRDKSDSNPGVRQSTWKAFTHSFTRAKGPLAMDERPGLIQNLQCKTLRMRNVRYSPHKQNIETRHNIVTGLP